MSTTVATSTSFQDLSSFANHLESSDDVSQALVPLAALAVKHASSIPGLEEVLMQHGWDGESFSKDINVSQLQRSLWRLYDNAASEKKRMLLARKTSDPLQAFRLTVLDVCAKTDLPSGQLQTLLTYHVMVTIIDLSKGGHDTELFKRNIEECGWNKQHYAFVGPPNRAKLLDLVYD